MKNTDQYVKVWVRCPYLHRLQTRFIDIDSIAPYTRSVVWSGHEIGKHYRDTDTIRKDMNREWQEGNNSRIFLGMLFAQRQ